MNIGIPKEIVLQEKRVALTPGSVQTLVDGGHKVLVQTEAGKGSGFYDDDYTHVGGQIVFSAEEVLRRADVIAKVEAPTVEELDKMGEGQTVFSFFHLAAAPKNLVEKILQRKINAIGYEIIERANGDLPILHSMSEIAGPMSVQIASRYLETDHGGRGMLLGGIPGVPPAIMVILGAGVVGTHAARAASDAGAQVILLDSDMYKLREVEKLFGKRVVTSIANPFNIAKAVAFADVLIGAVLIHGGKTPKLVTENMVKSMKWSAVIVDVSIDQGGCVETSHPTDLANPVFVKHSVIHYCVPNMSSHVARTGTYALSNAILHYLIDIADDGFEKSVEKNTEIRKGVYTSNGKCINSIIQELYNLK